MVPLILVTLTPEQIDKAKEANGKRKRITHALLCGPYGQIFGTEKQCRKLFAVWDPAYRIETSPGKFRAIFPTLFSKAVETNNYEIVDFETTFDLVNILSEAEDKVRVRALAYEHEQTKQSGCLPLILALCLAAILSAV